MEFGGMMYITGLGRRQGGVGYIKNDPSIQ
jgi:hypothetical protein